MVLNIGQHCSLRKPINDKIDHKAIVFESKWLRKPFQFYSNSRLCCAKNDCAKNNKSVFSLTGNSEFDPQRLLLVRG